MKDLIEASRNRIDDLFIYPGVQTKRSTIELSL